MVRRLWIDLIPSVTADLCSRKTFLAVGCRRQQRSLCAWPDGPVQSPICGCYTWLKMANRIVTQWRGNKWQTWFLLTIPSMDLAVKKSTPCQSLQTAAQNDKVTCQNVLKIPSSTEEKELVRVVLWVHKISSWLHSSNRHGFRFLGMEVWIITRVPFASQWREY